MAMVKWTPLGWGLRPWRSFEELRDEMDRLFDDMLGHRALPAGRAAFGDRAWVPAVDIIDKGSNLMVKAALPGVEKREVKVTVEGDVLTIRGERRAEEKTEDDNYYACEQCYGAFSRSVFLPVKVETGKVKADFKNGILTITLPKTKEAKPKEIEVAVK